MALNMSRHIEMLKVYLDAYDNPESMKKRIEALEGVLAVKPGEAGFPTRQHMLMEVAFMMKQKQKIIDFITEPRYMDVFQRSVKFLEKNPEPPKKKDPTGGSIAELYRAYTMPIVRGSYSSWYSVNPTFDNPSPEETMPTPAPEPAPVTTTNVLGPIRWDSLPDVDYDVEYGDISVQHGDPSERESRTSMETAHPQPRSTNEILTDLSAALTRTSVGDLPTGPATAAILEAISDSDRAIRELLDQVEEEGAARARAGSD